MVKGIDDMGRVNLTRRRLLTVEDKVREAGFAAALPDEHERDNLIASLAEKAPPAPPRGDRPGYGGDRDRGGRDRERRFGGDRPRRDR